MEINKIICGNTLTELKKLPNNFIDMIITSPPYYGLRNYGIDGQIGLEKTFEEYLKKILEITAELKRVLKPSGQFWLNMGDCYASSGSEESRFYHGKNQGKHKLSNDVFGGRSRSDNYQAKCMLMQPERLAIKMIDEQGWILRNKIKWAKQILIKKENRTIGSVMPTSVKDRFNESGEELYFFVKSKKYYSDLDAVRMPPQTFEDRPMGIIRQQEYEGSKYNKFNYRVRDAKRKAGQPQFKASEEEIRNYAPADKRGPNDNTEKNYGLKSLAARMADTKNKDQKSSRTYNIKKLLSEVRLGIKPNTGMVTNKVNDPRGNHEGGPGSWRDFKDNPENNFSDFISEKMKSIYGDDRKGSRRSRVREFQDNKTSLITNIAGKNIPTIWQIGSEPHNFQKEIGVDTDHFAIFPQALLDIPIRFGCPKGGLVLDPFIGSGTTAVVAKKLGKNYLGIELNEKYIKIAEARIKAVPQSLF